MTWTDVLSAVFSFWAAVFHDGDYGNDWLTHMPAALADAMHLAGWLVAGLLGL